MTSDFTIIGNLTRDPELRQLSSGQWVCQLGIATNRRWVDPVTQEPREQASFFEGSCFGDLAQNVAQSLSRGSRVIVHGYLRQDRWETPEGDKRSQVRLAIQDIGPSLSYATAKVIRTVREHEGAPDAGAPSPAPAVNHQPVVEEELF
jgi:single-strand DNA-binding protein